jgi:hypothetical protein
MKSGRWIKADICIELLQCSFGVPCVVDGVLLVRVKGAGHRSHAACSAREK